MSTIARIILAAPLVIILIAFGSVAFASTEVEVVEVIGSCDQGSVAAKISLFNGKEQDKSFKVILRLTQLVPPSSEFTLVEEVSGEVVVFAGEEGAASHTLFTVGVDPVATRVRIETGAPFTAVSESFSPCFQPIPFPSPQVASPVPTATSTRISEVTGVDRPRVTPETKVIGLPSSGMGGDEEVGWKSWRLWLAVGLVASAIGLMIIYPVVQEP